MPVSLTSEAVGVMNAGDGPAALFYEFLCLYFDGESHEVGGSNIAFPKATVQVGKGGNGEISETEIRMVIEQSSGTQYGNGTESEMHERQSFVLAVRAPQSADAKAVGQKAADLLYGLLRHKAETIALAEKGIYELQVKPPRTIGSDDFQTFLVMGTFKLILRA